MKISFAFYLAVLLITVFVQFGACYPIGDSQGGEELMLGDGGIGQQNGSTIKITGPGNLNVLVANNELAFGVCTNECNATFLVCYEADSENHTVVGECDSGCGFYVITQDDDISIMKPFVFGYVGEEKQDECESFSMINGQFFFRNVSFSGCTPKIENGMVKLNVMNASSNCPVTIKNAHVKSESTIPPPTTTQFEHVSATTRKGGNGTTTAVAPSFIDEYWWIILLIAIIIIVAITVGILVYCIKCKKEKKEPGPLARDLPLPKTAIVEHPAPDAAQEVAQPSYMNESSILSHRSLLQQA